MSTFISSFFGTEKKPIRKSKVSTNGSTKVSTNGSTKVSTNGSTKVSTKLPLSYNGYHFKEIKKSKTEGKRYDAIFINVKNQKEKKVSFGQKGEKDFIVLQDKNMRDFYDFKNKDKPIRDLMSRQALEKYILWNKPTLESSIKDYTKILKEKYK